MVNIRASRYSCSQNGAGSKKVHRKEHYALVQKHRQMKLALHPLQDTANPSFLYLEK